MAVKRRCVTFSGRVQGVGFRATVVWLARGFEVAGFVRNLADGRVELVAEGEPTEIVRLIDAIRAEMGAFITDIRDESESPAEPPLHNFVVRY